MEAARKVDGSANKNPVVSRREYLCDATFTAALEFTDDAERERAVAGLRFPSHTPFLGRRSCPLGRPLYEAEIEAESLRDALARMAPHAGVVYSEDEAGYHSQMAVRDVPLPGRTRSFATRRVYIRSGTGQATHDPLEQDRSRAAAPDLPLRVASTFMAPLRRPTRLATPLSVPRRA